MVIINALLDMYQLWGTLFQALVIAAISGAFLTLGFTQKLLRRVLIQFDFCNPDLSMTVTCSEQDQLQHGLLKVFSLQVVCNSGDLPPFLHSPLPV